MARKNVLFFVKMVQENVITLVILGIKSVSLCRRNEFMLRRKVENYLAQWKADPDKKPLVIKGIRQCGKTYIVKEFARANYENVVYINFILESDVITAFTGNKDVDTIILNISALKPDSRFVPGNTCLILDEIQDCPDARTSLKSFKEDGRFDVIATGSLLGVKGYGEKKKKKEDPRKGKNSVPVGYETLITMYPLDFEEFLWANGVNEKVINAVRDSFENERKVPDGMHKALMNLLYRYVVVGGLPDSVNTFLETKNIALVYKTQTTLLEEYKEDMVKYADDADKSRIRECFESIPKQLAKENKKFQYSKIKKGGRAAYYLGSLQWLEDAGIIRRCYNTTITELPLEGNAIADCFKVYVTDIGMLMAMLDFGTQANILQGDLRGFKGAIFESLMADVMSKKGKSLYYFQKDSGLELDFLMRINSKCTIVEVKARDGRTQSAKTVLAHPEKYNVFSEIKFGDYNVGREGQILTLPWYMAFLINDESDEMIVPEIDLDALSEFE